MRRCLAAWLAVTAGLLAVPASAPAAFPGENGDLVLALNQCHRVFQGYLAAVPWRGGRLRALTPSCVRGAELTAPPYRSPDAAADGRSVLAVEDGGSHGFVVLDTGGAVLRRFTFERPGGHFFDWELIAPSLAPDGRRFVFADDRGVIWIASTDGSRLSRLLRCWQGPSGGLAHGARWSPDGRRIAIHITYPGCSTGGRRLQPGVWLVRAADGAPVRRVAPDRAASVEWSPDGRSLVYTTHSQRDLETGYLAGGNLYVVGRDGRGTRKIVHRKDRAESQPTWSPDGRWIAWIGVDAGAGDVSPRIAATLYRVRARGGRPQRIQRLPEVHVEEGWAFLPQLTWSPAAR